MYYFKFHKILIFGRFCTHPLIGNLEKRNIGFLSLQESIDTTTSGGKLIFHIFSALAEFEKNLIQERTKAGLTAARQRGKKGGRPKALNPKQREIVVRLYNDRKNTVKEICETMKISKPTLYSYLRQENGKK